jgi:hypothetical protein
MVKRDMDALTSGFDDDLRRGGGLAHVLNGGEAYQVDITPGTEEELSGDETDELERCEQIVQRGLKTFFEVGAALVRVRDLRLYRVEHATFEDYCQARWDMGRRYVNQIIAAAQVQENLGAIAPKKLPANEAQVRPLTKLKDPEQQREAWQQVLERVDRETEGQLTAQIVEEVVRQLAQRQNGTSPHGDTGGDEPVVIEGTATESKSVPMVTLPEDLGDWTITTHDDHYTAECDGLSITATDADTLYKEARAVQELHHLGWDITQHDESPHWVGTHLEYDDIRGDSPSALLSQAQQVASEPQPTLSAEERTLLASIPRRLPGSPTSLHPLDLEAIRPLLEWMRERMH